MPERGGGGGYRGGRRPFVRGRGGRGGSEGRGAPEGRRPGGLGLRGVDGDVFELVHPPCVEERREDIDEGLEIWRAGEPEEARDALRFALEGCGDNLWAHVALGRIALDDARDMSLARGHFGYAFELARRAIPAHFQGRLPRDRPANGPLYDAIDGLIACHQAQGRARDVAELRNLAAAWENGRGGGPAPRPG